MSRIIEAKAVISAEDRTGKVFDQIARKFKEVGKGAKVSAEIDKMSKALKGVQDNLKSINDYQGKRSAFYTAKADMLAARKAAEETGRALAGAVKPSRQMEQAHRRAQAALDDTTKAFERQKAAVLTARRELTQAGVPVGGLVREQARLGRVVDQTNAAIRRQNALAKAEGGLASGMSGSGRRQHAQIARDRYVIDGMGAAGRAAIAERDRRKKASDADQAARQKEAQDARDARRVDRREAATTLGAGAAVSAGYKGKQIAKDAITAAAEFDLAVRKQKVFTDISDTDQAGLLSQARKIGQETQFSNIDVVKAQTAAMQGLPAGFAPKLKAEVAEGIIANVRNFSTLMETDLKDGTEIIRGYLQQSGKDISTKQKSLAEANKATNQLVKMAKLGGMDGEDVKNYTNYAIAPGTAAGLSPESLMALGALARRGGLRGDVGGVAVRSMASKIVAPTSKGLAALNAAGVDHSKFVKMPDSLSTSALEGQFRMKLGKGFTPKIRKDLDQINSNNEIIGDSGRYTEAVTKAVGDILGRTKGGKVRASDSQKAAKAAFEFHKVSAKSVDAEGLLDAAFNAKMTLPQLNAWLTDKHGGKGAITQRQWDEYHAARQQISKAAEDPDWAKKKADEVFAGLGGAVENLRGSIENLYLTIGNANAGLIKYGADKLGNGLDSFSSLSQGAQQGISLTAGAGLTAASAWGSLVLIQRILGLGALTGGAGAAGAAAGAGALPAAAAAGGAATLGVAGLAIATLAGAAVAAYATSQAMPKLAAEKGASGIDFATGGGLDANPMAGLAPDLPWLRDWYRSKAPTWAGGDPSGQTAAIGNTLDKATAASSTAANGGKPVEATLKPDQITAKVDTLPPVTGEAKVDVESKLNVIVTLNEPMLQAKIESAAGKAVARIPLSSSGARPGAVSMPGAAAAPGAGQ